MPAAVIGAPDRRALPRRAVSARAAICYARGVALPGPVFRSLTRTKAFSDRWIGDPWLNRLGLHVARIAATDACLASRRLLLARRARPDVAEALRRDGVVVIPDVLPAPVFDAMRAEVHRVVDDAAAAHPPPTRTDERGFGAKRPFPGGFDRFDGGTLNRFLDVDPARHPATAAAVRDPALAATCAYASGFRHRPRRFAIYQTVHGDEAANPDPQRVAHRDTFHSTIKLWLFVDDVRATDGPFWYAPGSHRMTPARYRWEHRRAVAASRPDAPDRDGSFRIDPDELPALGVPPLRAYPVAANTLVLADVRGFHRRGDAPSGTRRLSLYANLRLWPFTPVPY